MSRIVTRPEGERKQVTAVFLDLVGFSEVASTSDAEDLQDWLEEYYRRCGEIVEINAAVASAPELVNEDPYDKGWLLKVKPDGQAELGNLLDAAQYDTLTT